MPNNSVSTFLIYADLQMAAEALFDAAFVSGLIPIGELTDGNNRSSTFTPTQAALFVQDWKVVDHQRNTGTGFSGTLFECRRSDPARGLVEGQLVMCFRSTEFIDDAARDNQATNSMEIKPFGWAFGQIADMRAWYDRLTSEGKLPPSAPIDVTGYSLGGHLATAFNLLYPGAVRNTYTFNGAGVGRTINGVSLATTLDQFDQLRQPSADLSSLFTRADVRAVYQDLRNTLRGGALPTEAQRQAVLALMPAPGPLPTPALHPEVLLLLDAFSRVQTIQTEITRISGMPSGSSDSAPLSSVAATNIQATDINYQLAVLVASRNTAAISTGAGALQAITPRQPAPEQWSNAYDIYGAPLPSAVANSQLHYGRSTPVFIENQPLYRGSVIWDAITQSLLYNDVKLLVSGFAVNDFGDTHSLVLIVDSLSVQHTLARLDPNVSHATLDGLLHGASNARSRESSGSQGQADFDTLERVVRSLGDITGASRTSEWHAMNPNPTGGTWAQREDADGYTGRDTLHNNLRVMTESAPFSALAGQVQVAATHTASAAHDDFAALLSLTSGATFSLRLNDTSSSSP